MPTTMTTWKAGAARARRRPARPRPQPGGARGGRTRRLVGAAAAGVRSAAAGAATARPQSAEFRCGANNVVTGCSCLFAAAVRRRIPRRHLGYSAMHPQAVATAVAAGVVLCCYLLFASHSAFRCAAGSWDARTRLCQQRRRAAAVPPPSGLPRACTHLPCRPARVQHPVVGAGAGHARRAPLWRRRRADAGHLRVRAHGWVLGRGRGRAPLRALRPARGVVPRCRAPSRHAGATPSGAPPRTRRPPTQTWSTRRT